MKKRYEIKYVEEVFTREFADDKNTVIIKKLTIIWDNKIEKKAVWVKDRPVITSIDDLIEYCNQLNREEEELIATTLEINKYSAGLDVDKCK